MKLSKKAISSIDRMELRMKLGLLLGKSEMTIKRYLATNDVLLTTKQALEFIKASTGLTEEEILETESQNA